MSARDQRFAEVAAELGHDFSGPIQIGGNYSPLVVDGAHAYVSGQIPRVGNVVVVTGRAGADASLDDARQAARIGVMRALALLKQKLGSLDAVRRILRITVYVQCTDDFTFHSEVSDAASDILFRILGEAGVHSRTSLGVYQLPKNATVELDLIASLHI